MASSAATKPSATTFCQQRHQTCSCQGWVVVGLEHMVDVHTPPTPVPAMVLGVQDSFQDMASQCSFCQVINDVPCEVQDETYLYLINMSLASPPADCCLLTDVVSKGRVLAETQKCDVNVSVQELWLLGQRFHNKYTKLYEMTYLQENPLTALEFTCVPCDLLCAFLVLAWWFQRCWARADRHLRFGFWGWWFFGFFHWTWWCEGETWWSYILIQLWLFEVVLLPAFPLAVLVVGTRFRHACCARRQKVTAS